MDSTTIMSDEEILSSWYDFTSTEPGFVGYLLKLLRDREGTTTEEQQNSFGADSEKFRRLQAMPMPRTTSLSSDALRIAEACKLGNSFAFIQAMILASKLENEFVSTEEGEFYQAAFDPEVDLDEIPEEE
jgi:hypothetical protein